MPKKTRTFAEHLAKAIRSSNWAVANEAFTKLMVEKVDAKLNEERATLLSEANDSKITCKKCKTGYYAIQTKHDKYACPQCDTVPPTQDVLNSLADKTVSWAPKVTESSSWTNSVNEGFIVVAPEWPSGNVDKPVAWLKTNEAPTTPSWVRDRTQATVFATRADAKKAANKSMGRPNPTIVSEAWAPNGVNRQDGEKGWGMFRHAETKVRFEFRPNTDAWGKSHGFPQEIFVGPRGEARSALIKATVAYVVVDEGPNSTPITEKWPIRNLEHYQ